MPYRDITPSPVAPLPPHPLWEKLCLWAFVVFLPFLVPATIVKDAYDLLRLAALPSPLDDEGRARLLTRLEHEAPAHVARFVTVVHTIASGAEDVWHVIVVRFVDGSQHVVGSHVGLPTIDRASAVLAAVRRHRDPRAIVDEETTLGVSSLGIALTLIPLAVWALAVAILLAPLASVFVIAPLPLSLLLHAIAARCARHVIPSA